VSLPVKHEGSDKGELELFEGQEPADAVLHFAENKGMMAKIDMLMNAMCQTPGGAPLCSKGRALSHARRQLFDMKLTFMGLSHTIRYITSNGMADNWVCDEIADGMGESCEHMSVIVSRNFCALFARGLGPGNCETDILGYVSEQIDTWENRRWAGKEYYEYVASIYVSYTPFTYTQHMSSTLHLHSICFKTKTNEKLTSKPQSKCVDI
jgi:hypothetical protein